MSALARTLSRRIAMGMIIVGILALAVGMGIRSIPVSIIGVILMAVGCTAV